MYEVTDEKKVYASDTCTVLNHIGEYPHEQFALEQGAGGTEICLYDFNGPALIALCSGSGMLATGHMSHLIPVKYDGTRFVQDIEPVGYNKFAGYDDNLLESLRPQFEALGTASLSNDDVKEIYQNLNAITKYLENPRVIVKASSTIIESDYYNKYEEWRKGAEKPYVIHFAAIFLGVTVQASYCIWNDAYVGLNTNLKRFIAVTAIVSVINLAVAFIAWRTGSLFADGRLQAQTTNLLCGLMFAVLGITGLARKLSAGREDE